MSEPIRLLVLEDNRFDAELVLTTLEKGGLAVAAHHATTRGEFEDALAQGVWALVLADYSLPAFTGLDALAAVRALDPLLPFILISGTLGDERAIESLKSGATDYVLKDNLSRLVPAVLRALSEHRERLRHLATQRALQHSEERYRAIVEDQTELVCRLTPEGAFTFANRAFCRFADRTFAQMVGTSILAFVHQEDRAPAMQTLARISRADPLINCEHRLIDAAGRVRWHQWTQRGLFDASGRMVEVQAVGRDATELVEALKALRESEARFARAVRGSKDGLWEWRLGGDHVYYSPRFRALLGWNDETPSGGDTVFRNALHPDDAARVTQAIASNVAGGPPFDEEFRLRQPDGGYRWFIGRGETDRAAAGHALHFSGSITDVSQRKQFEESLRIAHQRLQRLSRRATEVLEAERRHLSRELHDEVGQVLTAVKINLESVARQISEPALIERLRDSMEVTSIALSQVRRLSLNLRPAQLDDMGLVSALRGHLNRQAAVGNFTAHFDATTLPRRMSNEIETACFRVSQEAITNILRHAKARNVWIELGTDPGQVILSVRDDGVGFVVEAGANRATSGESLGLLSMEERVALIGGTLTVHSQLGHGTEVRARVPLARS
jgi:two-component system, NarL family, sensor histidine kinase UhpB